VSPTFKKRELVVTTEEQYPQHIMVEFTQDKCDLLDSYQVGEPVKVSINLRGREWVSPQGETKYFNSIQGWRIERLTSDPMPQGGQSMGQPMPTVPVTPDFEQATNFNEAEHDDLPF
jgi:hypothetical protein